MPHNLIGKCLAILAIIAIGVAHAPALGHASDADAATILTKKNP